MADVPAPEVIADDITECPDCGLSHCICFDDDDQSDDDWLGDCHMGPDGYCGAAGSEYCDWDCPLSRAGN